MRHFAHRPDNELSHIINICIYPNDCSAKAAYLEACSSLQNRLCTLKNSWWTEIAEHTQRLADAGDTGPFYEALKAVFGPQHQTQASLRSLDGSTLLKDKDSIMQRWAEHFKKLFKDKRSVQESSLDLIPQKEVRLDLEVPPSTIEIEMAIAQMKSGKSPGRYWNSRGNRPKRRRHCACPT